MYIIICNIVFWILYLWGKFNESREDVEEGKVIIGIGNYWRRI